MRVLIISQNSFSKVNNMGKTLKSYFSSFSVDELAQLYIQPEIPSDNICKNYYRITDKEMIKSIFTRKSGKIFSNENFEINTYNNLRNNSKIYQFSRRRNPLIYIMRNLLWKIGKWRTKKLLLWINGFNPDVVFFASGDYSFSYDIALRIAKYKKIPLVISCVDDYYLNNKNSKKFLGKWQHKIFMKNVHKVFNYCQCIFTICKQMGIDYSKMFKKEYYVLYTSCSFDEPLKYEKRNSITYIGNLGYKRNKQLIDIGKTLLNINDKNVPNYIDVYSSETRKEILDELNMNNGIIFHGFIDYDNAKRIMGESSLIIHVESFDEDLMKRVKYSVSTKIADSLMSGTCILAYGPNTIESIKYLLDNNAALCITNKNDLEKKILEVYNNHLIRESLIDNAISLAKKNHNCKNNSRTLYEILTKMIANRG